MPASCAIAMPSGRSSRPRCRGSRRDARDRRQVMATDCSTPSRVCRSEHALPLRTVRPSPRWRRGSNLCGRCQCGLHGVQHELVHRRGVAKAHLDLGGVHVDVDAPRVDGKVQAVHRLAGAVQDVRIRGAHRMREHAITDVTAVDEEILCIGARPARRGRTDPAVQTDSGRPRQLRAAPWRTHPAAVAVRAAVRPAPTARAPCALVKDSERDAGWAAATRSTWVMQWASSVASRAGTCAGRRLVEQVGTSTRVPTVPRPAPVPRSR